MAIDTQALSDRIAALEATLGDVRSVLQTLGDITSQAVRVMEQLAGAQTQADIDALAERAQALIVGFVEQKDAVVSINVTLNEEVIRVDPTRP